MSRRLIKSLVIIVTLISLNGCSLIQPVTRLVGGTLNATTQIIGAAANVASKSAKTAAVVAPFLI